MPEPGARAQLIYDGDCGICRYWVNYWQGLTGDSVAYRPYQQALADYPDISEEEFRRSIQLIFPDGRRYEGAGAVYTLLRSHFPYNLWYRCYHWLPGFAWCAELGYRFFSRHRGLLRFLSNTLWGRKLQPARYDLVSGLFLRLLGVIYLSAFASLAVQVTGLAGSNGVLPVAEFLQRATNEYGATAWLKIPTLFWLFPSDIFLQAACWLGIGSSLLIICNIATRSALVVNFILYLSLVYACQVFTRFQWDLLLLECGFLALFLSHGSWIVVALYRWLLFRFLLFSGLVKLISGDSSWDNLTALFYHFETQPLPTPLAWHAHHLPDSLLIGLTAATLIIELVLPFFLLAPRNIRMLAGWIFIFFQVGILLTGNYNFFNLLTIIICLFLFDDAAVRKILPGAVASRLSLRPRTQLNRWIPGTVATLVICLSITQIGQIITNDRVPLLSSLNSAVTPFHIVNQYGPFAVMTRTRNEIIVQGSNDGRHWQSYRFRYNPGDVTKRPEWIIPHQPRLDWQMWFAVLSTPERNPWFILFMKRLLEGSNAVTELLQENPFADQPPEYVRAVVFEYRFSDPRLRKQQNQWWVRSAKGLYMQALTLDGGQLQRMR